MEMGGQRKIEFLISGYIYIYIYITLDLFLFFSNMYMCVELHIFSCKLFYLFSDCRLANNDN